MALALQAGGNPEFDLMSEAGERWVRIFVKDAAAAAYPSGGYPLPPSLFGFQAGFMRRKLGGASGNDVVFAAVIRYNKVAAAPVCDVDPTTGNLKFFTNAGAEVAANTDTSGVTVTLEAFGH